MKHNLTIAIFQQSYDFKTKKSSKLPIVATAMHDGVNPPIEELVFGLEAPDPEGARRVVHPAASIRLRETTQMGVPFRRKSLSAPLGPRHLENLGQVALPSVRRRPPKDKKLSSSKLREQTRPLRVFFSW